MAFTDETTIRVIAGKGGDGCASFHSEPYKSHGGPDGGDGGHGGAVVLEVSRGVHDLSWLARHPHQSARGGGNGGSDKRTGASAKELILAVPDGTVVRDERGFVADLVGEGARVVVAAGGRGGRGNTAFASGRNRAPRESEAGEPGDERQVSLELRTIADVGLVGLPSAGKSTLLAALTAARPKIAAYPFTTLTPNVGVAEAEHRFVLADVPGLIEGASEGRGLGHQFLRHISRCSVLAYVVDATALDPAADVQTLRGELAAFDPQLLERPTLVVATKIDLLDPETIQIAVSELDGEVVEVSGVTGQGVDTLSERLASLVAAHDLHPVEEPRAVVLRPGKDPFTVRAEGERFRVAGRRVERWVAQTDLEDDDAVEGLQRRLKKEGVEIRLVEAGAKEGDEVVIGALVFEFLPDEVADMREREDV